MSGLRKAKEYDWKDSNLALFGSDTEKQVKKESAECEPAWQGSADKIGLTVWRIVKFQVTEWPKEDYGKFYTGDSYIVLNAYKKEGEDKINYDVHFWIGTGSTQDEYGTAAYKTVELDTFLDDAAIQHREVQGHESDLFKSYFTNISILKGGAKTGFRHVEPEEYKPRLFHFHGKGKHVVVVEVPCNRQILKDDDVYILDKGKELIQFNGKSCNAFEKSKAAAYLQQLESEQNAKSEVFDQLSMSPSHPFYGELTEDLPEDFVEDDEADTPDCKKLFKVCEENGEVNISEVKAGDINRCDFNSDDVFMLDNIDAVFVFVGSNASKAEKSNGLPYANEFKQVKQCLLTVLYK